MREIKFRAWEKEDKIMQYYPWVRMQCDEKEITSPDLNGQIKAIQDSDILMQYTGLKDKNGKEIYEGDIVKDTNGYKLVIVWGEFQTFWNGTVSNTSLGWHCRVWRASSEKRYIEGYTLTICHISEKEEVIGNIYENPELINKKQREA